MGQPRVGRSAHLLRFLQQFPKCRSIVSFLKWDKIFFGFARHSYQYQKVVQRRKTSFLFHFTPKLFWT
jgi:hypothetical protein